MKTIRLKLNQPSDPGWTPSTVKRRRHRGAEASPVIASSVWRFDAQGMSAMGAISPAAAIVVNEKRRAPDVHDEPQVRRRHRGVHQGTVAWTYRE